MSAIDTQLVEFATSELPDALDELGITGAVPDLVAQRIGQGRITGRVPSLCILLRSPRTRPRTALAAA